MGEVEKEATGLVQVGGSKKEGESESRSDHKSSSSSSSHKHKSKDKDRERDRDRDRNKDKERKDKDRGKEREKDKHHSSSSSKDKERSENKEKDRSEKDKDRSEKDKSRSEKDRDRSERDKDRSDRDKNRDKSRSDEKQVNGHSSSSKDKDRKDRDKDRKDKDKDKERSKDRHSSSHKDKHRDKDREKDKGRSRDKDRKDKVDVKAEETAVKHEVEHNVKVEVEEEKTVVTTNTTEEVDVDQEISEGEVEETVKAETTVKTETVESDAEDVPLSKRKSATTNGGDSDSDIPLSARKKIKTEVTTTTTVKKEKKRKVESDQDEYDDYEEEKKKKKKKVTKKVKVEETTTMTKKRVKKEEEEAETWKWWEEEKLDEGTKWKTLEHQGPVFAPEYEPLPKNIKFYYNGKQVQLSQDTEEIATFYGRMLDHDYTSKEVFNTNFFKDWRKVMTKSEKELITDLKKCDFREIDAYFKRRSEENKNRTKAEKLKLKEENERLVKEYGFCMIDNHKQRIGNFKIEPPGLFRGRGDHPKMGMVKKRVMPEEVIINCSKGKAPPPPEGHRWKEVRQDNTVTWLASWTENVQGQVKYVMLNAASHLKGEKDWQKYEVARKLNKMVHKIRERYADDWKSKEMRIRQRAVALYFIDKLALRAGNEKDEDQADTVGCCSLRVEHVSLDEKKNGKECVVTFDFLGKDSIRYYNEVAVEKRVFKNLQIFTENKQPGDDLFDRLNTAILNKHLNEIMEGLTAKVFRTYNASFTLQDQLDKLTNANDSVAEKILSYNRANRAVAILCNHQRAVPKTFGKSMENMKIKIDAKLDLIAEAEKNLKDAKKDVKRSGSMGAKAVVDKCEKTIARLKDQLQKLELQATDREENKDIALGTSKLNYLDPRISVAWCKKNNVPIEKVYNKTQRAKFQWAIDMAGPDFVF